MQMQMLKCSNATRCSQNAVYTAGSSSSRAIFRSNYFGARVGASLHRAHKVDYAGRNGKYEVCSFEVSSFTYSINLLTSFSQYGSTYSAQ
jgi:hypothetical protein